MRQALLALAALVSACGGVAADQAPLRSPAVPSPTPSPSLQMTVERMAGSLSFQPFVPTELTPGLFATVRLDPGRTDALGAALLVIELATAPGGKPVLSLTQGPGGCCLARSRPGVELNVVLRTPPPNATVGPHVEVRGELIPASAANEATTLWWLEETWFGNHTYLELSASASAAALDTQALIRIARSVMPVERPAAAGEVVLYWSTFESHAPNGHRVFVGVKGASIPDEARLLDGSGRIVTSARFEPPAPYDCLRGATGVAPFAVPREVVRDLTRDPAPGYRVEVRVGGAWTQAQLVSAGCFSIE